jgi:hypothetical protein
MINYKYIIIIIIFLIIYGIIIKYRYCLYFIPNKIIHYKPKDYNIKYNEINIGKLNGWFFPNNNYKSKKIMIYFHGNAGNISNRIFPIKQLLSIFNDTDIYIFDYPQFGLSNGILNLQNIISTSYIVYDYWSNKYNDIIMFGESIGSGIMAEVYNLLIKRNHHNLPKILVHLNGITTLYEVINNIIPYIIKPFIIPWITEYNCKLIYMQNIKNLPKIILIHSKNDDIIPIKFVKNMLYDLRLSYNIFMIIIDGTHNEPIFDITSINKIKSIYY